MQTKYEVLRNDIYQGQINLLKIKLYIIEYQDMIGHSLMQEQELCFQVGFWQIGGFCKGWS